MEFSFRHHRHRRHEECSDRDLLLLIILELEVIEEKIDALLPPLPPPDLVGGYIILDAGLEGESMTDISVPAGTTSIRAVATFLDANDNTGVPATPPVWAVSDDTLASVTPDASDATGQSADVALVATDSAVSVSVTSTATNADGTVDALSATITVEAAVPPPVPDLVGGDILLTAGA